MRYRLKSSKPSLHSVTLPAQQCVTQCIVTSAARTNGLDDVATFSTLFGAFPFRTAFVKAPPLLVPPAMLLAPMCVIINC